MVHFFLLFCVGVVVVTIFSLIWNFILRPVFYSSGWLRPTAHDLEVEGWQAECADDVPTALRKYAESVTLDPRNPHLLARFEALLDANDWIRFEWPEAPPGAR